MEMQDYIRIIVKYLRVSLLGAVIGLLIGLALNWYTQYIPLYSATSAVMVGGDVATVQSNSDYRLLASQFTETYANLVTREPVLQGVIDTLGLKTTPKSLKSYVSATVIASTQVIEITASDKSAKTAAAIANEAAHQLILFSPRVVRNFVLSVDTAPVPNFPALAFFLIPMIAGILGFLVVGGIAFLIEFMRSPVYSAEELNRRTGVPVLFTVRSRPKAQNRNQRRRDRKSPSWRKVNEAPWLPLVQTCQEHFEALNLPTNPHPKKPLIMVTSPIDSKDKAVVAANLSTAWSKMGAKVVLVDADIASPQLEKWFKLSNQPGLMDLVKQTVPVEKIQETLQSTSIPGLMVLPIGTVDDTSYDSLNAESLHRVVSQLSQQADAIVVNGPSVLTGDEAAVIASQAHGVLLALRSGETTLQATTDARDVLSVVNGNLLGSVLLEGKKP